MTRSSRTCNFNGADSKSNPIVGAWFVKDSGAPFPYHMYVFNADGTMQQANPNAGDPHTSDSDGKGIWLTDGHRIKGKWMEVIADRATHKYAGRTEISFDIKANIDAFAGTETVRSKGLRYPGEDEVYEKPILDRLHL